MSSDDLAPPLNQKSAARHNLSHRGNVTTANHFAGDVSCCLAASALPALLKNKSSISINIMTKKTTTEITPFLKRNLNIYFINVSYCLTSKVCMH